MQLPNALWLSIIAAAQMIVNQNFPDYWFTPVVLAGLIAVGKLVQVSVTDPTVPVQTDADGTIKPMASPRGAGELPVKAPGKVRRFLLE